MERKVNITSRIPGAEIHYELDGSDPTAESPLYTEPVTITQSSQVRARTFKFGMAYSDVAAVNVTMPQKVPTPTLELSRSGSTVYGVIGNTISGAIYRYKVGSAPNTEGQGTIISGTTFNFSNSNAITVYVRGFKDGYEMSDAVSASVDSQPQCATPSISNSGNTVTITSTTDGAVIYYTTNGDTPTSASTVYSAPFEIFGSATIKAIAKKVDYRDSAVATLSIVVTLPTPVLQKQAGTAIDNCKIIISNTDDFASYSNVVFRYTTDGSDPIETSITTTGEIAIDKNCTVKVKAFYEVGENSATASIAVTDLKVQTPIIVIKEE